LIGGVYYRGLTLLARYLGPGVFRLGAAWVAAAYYGLYPRRVRTSMEFYRALFPGQADRYYRHCAWRQFQSFTNVYLDRFLLQSGGQITHRSEGWDVLEKARARGRGGILLMSHMGSWELAAHLMKKGMPELPLLLYMGEKQREQIEKVQKQDLRRSGIRILAAGSDAASPFQAVEGVNHLKQGGWISMTGDMLRQTGQRCVTVEFLKQRARLPAAPYALAMVAGVPLHPFFTRRTGPQMHLISIGAPIEIPAVRRPEREAAIQAAAQTYADRLAQQLRRQPFEWYHFDPFLVD
jgi:predicted LPLAT superfamily acyltransferase